MNKSVMAFKNSAQQFLQDLNLSDLSVDVKLEGIDDGCNLSDLLAVFADDEFNEDEVPDTEEALLIVSDLAEWSKKYPRQQIYSSSRQPEMDGELIKLEERAKTFIQEHDQPTRPLNGIVKLNIPFTIKEIESWLESVYGHVPTEWNLIQVVRCLQQYHNTFDIHVKLCDYADEVVGKALRTEIQSSKEYEKYCQALEKMLSPNQIQTAYESSKK